MKYRSLTLTLILIICIAVASAQDISTKSGRVNVQVSGGQQVFQPDNLNPLTISTYIDGEKFSPASTDKKSESNVRYASGEKSYLLFPDPVVMQDYKIFDNGTSEETLYLKSQKAISWKLSLATGDSARITESGSIRIDNPSIDEMMNGHIEILAPIGWDASGTRISYSYKLDKDIVTLLEPFGSLNDKGEDIKYPAVIDPIAAHRFDLAFLNHCNLEPPSMSTTTIQDSSRYFNLGGVTGTSSINSTLNKYGNASCSIKGSSTSNITYNDAPQYTFGTNNFSISGWVYFPATAPADNVYLWMQYDNASNYHHLYASKSDNQIYWTSVRGGSTLSTISTVTPVYAGMWNHIAYIQNGTTGKTYLNGTVLGTTGARAGSFTDLTKLPYMGPTSGTGIVHLDELQIFNGGFAPAITDLYPGGEYGLYLNGTLGGYADDNSTVSLLHFDGINDGTGNITDQYANRTWTRSGSPVSATNASKFGPTGEFFSASGTLTTPYTSSFDMGTGDFTVDGWVRFDNTTGGLGDARLLWSGTYPVAWSARVTPTYIQLLGHNTGGWTAEAQAAQTVTQGTYYHYAIVRNGTSVKFFRDGVLMGTSTIPIGYTYNAEGNSTIMQGFYVSTDEPRVTKGLARWTGNFTPPYDPYELIEDNGFTATPDASGTVPVTIQFADTTPSSAWTVNGHNWSFGDGSYSSSQSPSHIFSTTGLFNVSHEVFNNNMTTTTYMVVPVGAPVVAFVGSPRTGTAALTVTFTDLTTNATPITSYLIDFGDGESSTVTPPWTHVYATFGAYSVNLTETNSVGTGFHFERDYIVTSTSQESQNTIYIPSQVRFKFMDFNTIPLDNLSIVATPLNFTGSINWTSSLIGIRNSVNILGTTVQGYTATDGSIVFPMLDSQRYSMQISGIASDGRVVSGFNITIYPSAKDYVYAIPTDLNPVAIPTSLPQSAISYTITNASVNNTATFYNVSYNDPTSGTTAITFYITNTSGDIVYSQTVTGAGANTATFSNITLNPDAGAIEYGFVANQSTIDNVSASEILSFPWEPSLGGDGPGEHEVWLALAIVLLIGMFGFYMSSELTLIAMCMVLEFFVDGVHWLEPTMVGKPAYYVIVSAFVIMAGISYMRKREDAV